jgi:hypothetical protein
MRVLNRPPSARETENERQGIIDSCHLAVAEVPDAALECLCIHDAQLIGQYAGGRTSKVNRGTKRSGRRGARRGGDQHGAQVEQLVRLHDDPWPRSPLLMPARTTWRAQPHDLSANHQSAGHGGVSLSSSSRSAASSARSIGSAASRRASSRSATRRRRRARASVNALRTAWESLIPSARSTASAASESASSRTWRARDTDRLYHKSCYAVGAGADGDCVPSFQAGTREPSAAPTSTSDG